MTDVGPDRLQELFATFGTVRATAGQLGVDERSVVRWAQEHGIEYPRYRRNRRRAAWPSEEEVREALERFGNATAAASFFGRSPETMREIVRRYGIKFTPKNATRTTGLGWAGEEHAALLLGADFRRGRDPRDQPFDLIWGGKRVEVKTARPSYGRSRGKAVTMPTWIFNLAKNREYDVCLLIACSAEGIPLRYFAIPAAEIDGRKTLQVSASLRGKWARFEVRPTLEL